MSEIASGSIRFNTDSAKMEIYNGEQWWEIDSTSPTEQTGGTRGLFAGGYASGASSPKTTNTINFVNVDTTGNASDFGDVLSGANQDIVPCGASRTRGVFRDGSSGSMTFITFASTGNSATFGTSGLTSNRANGLSNETRGVHAGAADSTKNQIDYITISSTGNSVDFGNLATGAFSPGTGASFTRGIFAGCATHPAYQSNAIEFITISTLGNAADFGDLVTSSSNTYLTSSSSNAVKMLQLNDHAIESIIISTLGNATDFGDTSSSISSRGGGCSSPTRAVFAGGEDPNNNIEYVEFATAANAVDFGDLTYVENRHGCGMSNGHGGLG